VAEKEWLLNPLGLPGTAGRGPACPVVWEAGGEIPPPTRLLGNRLFEDVPILCKTAKSNGCWTKQRGRLFALSALTPPLKRHPSALRRMLMSAAAFGELFIW
jgi:hypothetical protein